MGRGNTARRVLGPGGLLLQVSSSPCPVPVCPSSREQSCHVFFSTPSLSYHEQEKTAQTFFQNKGTSYHRLRALSSMRRGPQPPRNARGISGHSAKQGSVHCGFLRVTALGGPGDLHRSSAAPHTAPAHPAPRPPRACPSTPRHHAASLLVTQRSLGTGSTSPLCLLQGVSLMEGSSGRDPAYGKERGHR